MMKRKNIFAYYFPNWHVDALNEKWHGRGWTEWEVVKCARARFEGHAQPKVPLWGYEDEADPRIMEKKIRTAPIKADPKSASGISPAPSTIPTEMDQNK